MSFAFQTNSELRKNVLEYLVNSSDTESDVAQFYGHPIGIWDVSEISDFSNIFRFTGFTGLGENDEDINSWDVSSSISFVGMFYGAKSFNGNLTGWKVENAITMSTMFANAESFNPTNVTSIGQWDVAKVTDFSYMFDGARSVDDTLNSWAVGSASNFHGMFRSAQAFNQNLSAWDISNAVDISEMFSGAELFNGDLSTWEVGKVITMSSLLNDATSYNSDISNWDVSKVQDMSLMFRNTSLDVDYCAWVDQLTTNTNTARMFFTTNCARQVDPSSGVNETTNNLLGPFCADCGFISSAPSSYDNAGSLSLLLGVVLSYLFWA
jgi:surface protein